MPTPAKPAQFPPSKKSEEMILSTLKLLHQRFSSIYNIRARMMQMDYAYNRELDNSQEHRRAKTANAYGDKTRIQNIQFPIVQPQVEAGVSYLNGVFLQGYPIFGVVADKENQDAAMMYEALMAEHSVRGGWVRELQMAFRDGLKYNLAACEVKWAEETVWSVDTQAVGRNGAVKQKETIWQGNKLRRLDLYNTIWDTRVAPSRVHIDGEYAGYLEVFGRARLKQFLQDLGDKIAANVQNALNSESGGQGAYAKFFVPPINQSAMVTPNNAGTTNELDWISWATNNQADKEVKLPAINEVATYYMRIIPSDFGLKVPSRNTLQIWKFIVINNQHLVYAELQSNMHNFLPILFMQPLEDGLGYMTKSYAANAAPMQEVASALLNATLHAKRRAVYDRIFYDPLRIRKEDINSNNPIARIPVKAGAYGKAVGDAIHAVPFRDDQFGTAIQEIQMIENMTNKLQGLNQVQQGQFVKGNKTKHEFGDVMAHSNDRLQTIAMCLEAQFFTPLKEMLKLNILQYATDGSVYSVANKQAVQVDVNKLRQASLAMKISDGLLPSDKLIDADMLQVVIQTSAASPLLQSELDLTGMILYYFKTGGVDINDFKLTDEQKQARLQQMQAAAAAQQPQQQQQPQQGVPNGQQAG